MKRISVYLLALLLALTTVAFLASCEGGGDDDDDDNAADDDTDDDTDDDAEGWQSYVIDSCDPWAPYSSIAINENKNLYIAYSCGNELKFAYKNSDEWVIETVHSISDYSFSPLMMRLMSAGGKDSIAYIAYHSFAVNPPYYHKLNFAVKQSGSWELYVVDERGVGYMIAYDLSLSLDSSSKAHIAYSDNSAFHLLYATNASGAWVISELDSELGAGSFESVAADSNDKLHIAYIHSTNSSLLYLTNKDGVWQKSVIDEEAQNSGCSLDIDGSNALHIAYQSYDMKLRYATNASSDWNIEDVDDNYNCYSGTLSLAVHPSGSLHIAYITGESKLKYATKADDQWQIEELAENASWSPSLAVDEDGFVHISYGDSKSNELVYITNTK